VSTPDFDRIRRPYYACFLGQIKPTLTLAGRGGNPYIAGVAQKTEELVAICEQLPPQKVEELVDFARFLQHQAAGDAQWESIINAPQPRPKLDAFVQQSLGEGEAMPLDPEEM
jgi:hypothetical protein